MPRINAKKLHHEKKQVKRAKMPTAGNFFFTLALRFQLFVIGLR